MSAHRCNIMLWIIPDDEVRGSPRAKLEGSSQIIVTKAEAVLSSLKTFIERSLYSLDKIIHMSDE